MKFMNGQHGDFGPDHDDFHIFTAVYIDAICPAFVFRYDPEKKNCRPRRGTGFASGQRLQMGYFTNFWKTHGDYLGKSWISWDPFLGFIGIQIWIPWRKKNAPILVP